MNAKFIQVMLLAVGIGALVGCSSSGAADNSSAPVYQAPVPTAPAPTELAPANPVPAAVPAPNEVASVTVTPDTTVAPAPVLMSANVSDVAQLARAGVSERLIQNFINNTREPFRLTAKDIIYLNDLGVADNVVDAMMEHDRKLGYQVAEKPAPVAETVVEQATPAPETVVVVQQPAPVTVNYFYDSLTPYGTWVEVDGYGRCWRPTVVIGQPNWRPYCDRGHWVYTSCGWYWESDYSWGVTFHYGRWFNHARFGWCWFPDVTWGPAWVSWRESSDYCGWAPLPPYAYYRPGSGYYYRGASVSVSFSFGLDAGCYTFVPRNHFGGGYRPHDYAAPSSRNTTIINNTTVVNNYVTGNNNTVINQGISTGRGPGKGSGLLAPHYANPRGTHLPPVRTTMATASAAASTPAAPVNHGSQPFPGGKDTRRGSDGWKNTRQAGPGRSDSQVNTAVAPTASGSVSTPAAPPITRATPAVTRSQPGSGTRNYSAPAPTVTTPAPAPAVTAPAPHPATPAWNRDHNAAQAIRDRIVADQQRSHAYSAPAPAPSVSTPSYSAPSYSTPSYSTPSYSAPSQPTVRPSAPAPSYSTPSYSTPSAPPSHAYNPPAPQPAPQPHYAPQPAPQPQQPAQSSSNARDEVRQKIADDLKRGGRR